MVLRYLRGRVWRHGGSTRKRIVQIRMMRGKRRRMTLFRRRGRGIGYRKKRFMRKHGWQWRGRGGKKVVPMTYTYVGGIASNTAESSNLFASGPFQIDNCYDPNPNLTGAWNVSSAGYDFWSKYYTRYRVVSAKISCRAVLVSGGMGGHYPVVCGYSINPTPGSGTDPAAGVTWMQMAARGNCCFLSDPQGNRSDKKIRSKYWSRMSVDDRRYRDLATACGSSPAAGDYTKLWLWMATSDQALFTGPSPVAVRFVLRIKQYVEMSGAIGPEFEDRVQGRGLWAEGPEIEFNPPLDPAVEPE
ncbi:capsid [uncultured virus]|uniref:Capsid n=1 Tax=uncultured virus TaxID=340016 RepID=A0A2K9LS59_9VIRU|nr:capsid [uncultured virus]